MRLIDRPVIKFLISLKIETREKIKTTNALMEWATKYFVAEKIGNDMRFLKPVMTLKKEKC